MQSNPRQKYGPRCINWTWDELQSAHVCNCLFAIHPVPPSNVPRVAATLLATLLATCRVPNQSSN